METSSTSTVLEDVNALRSLVLSVLPQLLIKLDLIGDKLEKSPTTPTTTSTKRVEISTQTEGEFVDGSHSAEADVILEDQDDGIPLEDLLWAEAALPGGIKVESSSEGGAAEGIECCEDNNVMRRNMDGDFGQVVFCSLNQVYPSVGSAGNNDTVLNTTCEEWSEPSVAAKEFVINSHSPDVKPDLASTSNMSMYRSVAGSSAKQQPHQKNMMSLAKRRQSSIRGELNQSEKKSYKCGYCLKSFTRKYDIDRHERVHTGEKPFKCRYCPKTFSQQSYIVVHERCHTGEKPYKCRYCSKTFSQPSNFAAHERCHNGEKPFKCSYCSMEFNRRYNVVSHERRSHGTDP